MINLLKVKSAFFKLKGLLNLFKVLNILKISEDKIFKLEFLKKKNINDATKLLKFV